MRAPAWTSTPPIASTDDTTVIDAIPCTTWPRTLLDLAAVVPGHRLEQALHRADDQQLLDMRPLLVLLAAHPTRPGTRRLRLAAYAPGDRPESELEISFHRLCAEAQLPKPHVNRWIALPDGRMIRPDTLWPDHRLVVEVDSPKHHGSRHGLESDRLRDADLLEAGYGSSAQPIASSPDVRRALQPV